MKMLPHQQRVVEELHDLRIRLASLDRFMASDAYSSVPRDESKRLYLQRIHMVKYADVLADRVAHFKD